MKNLKNQLIRLGNQNPSLQKHLKPVLATIQTDKTGGRNFLRSDQYKKEVHIVKSLLEDAMKRINQNMDGEGHHIEDIGQDTLRGEASATMSFLLGSGNTPRAIQDFVYKADEAAHREAKKWFYNKHKDRLRTFGYSESDIGYNALFVVDAEDLAEEFDEVYRDLIEDESVYAVVWVHLSAEPYGTMKVNAAWHGVGSYLSGAGLQRYQSAYEGREIPMDLSDTKAFARSLKSELDKCVKAL